jgi:hypothetical protein
MPPLEALRAWMLLYVDYIATKKIIAPALNAPERPREAHCGFLRSDPGSYAITREACD